MSAEAIARKAHLAPGTAEWEAERNKVIGFNHVRRSPEDKEADERTRSNQAPRWRRRLRYKFHNSTRGRLVCILLVCCAMSAVSLGILWSVGEVIAGLAVAGSALGLGLLACGTTEVLVRCPKLTEGLLFHLGILERVYIEEEVIDGYSYEVHEGQDGNEYGQVSLHTVPDDADYPLDQKVVISYPHYDEEAGEVVGILGKPLWGDVAPDVHTTMAQAKRAGHRVLSAMADMTNSTQRDYDELRAFQAAQDAEEGRYYPATEDPVAAATALEMEQRSSAEAQHQQQQQQQAEPGYEGDRDVADDSPAPDEPAKAQDKVD